MDTTKNGVNDTGRRPARPRPASARALGPTEKQNVLGLLHSDRFVDQAPASVFAGYLVKGHAASRLCRQAGHAH